MRKKIWLSSPHMGGAEQKYVREAFDSNWIAPLGANVDGFEDDLVRYTGAKAASALTTGTAAIHLALYILGVGPGDEALASSFTFAATVNPIRYLGATPILIDSEPETWNMCPKILEKAITDRIRKGKKPKAIIPVHLYGMPAKIDEIMAVANNFGIPVVEDAAEALGSCYNGKFAGTFGTIGIFSFNGNKIITTSGGGAIISNDKEIVAHARFLSSQARDNAPHYQHSTLGYNYRMSNVCAGIGRGQMEVLDKHIALRRENYRYYKTHLGDIDGITFQDEPNSNFFSNYWLTAILIDPKETGGVYREDIRKALNADNIDSRPLWKPMHLQPLYRDIPYYGGRISEGLFENGLCLPSGSNLADFERERIVNVILKTIAQGTRVKHLRKYRPNLKFKRKPHGTLN
jgi:dTDP-4-amino-4,6-dideoxygalactose transaminase